MKFRTVFVVLICLAIVHWFASPASAQTTALVNGNVVDVIGERILPDTTVVVEDGIIIQIVPAAEVDTTGIDEVIDLTDMYLLPGFVDAHVHISTLEGAQNALLSGATTVRSAAAPHFADVGLKALAKRDPTRAPEFLVAGAFIEPDIGANILADPRFAVLADGVDTENDLRLMVEVNVERGADWIKTRASMSPYGWFLKPWVDGRKQVYSQTQLEIIVDEATKAGKPVMVHTHGREATRASVHAGVTSVEHGTGLDTELLEIMKERGMALSPTLTWYLQLEDTNVWNTGFVHAHYRWFLDRQIEVIKQALEMGIKVVIGTDEGYPSTSSVTMGRGVLYYTEIGVEPWQALRCATSDSAEVIGVGHRTGQIREGYEADLVVFFANPIENKYAISDVPLLVMSNGVVALNQLPLGLE
jgi:imidazolonepropionase-like amidohydrolase